MYQVPYKLALHANNRTGQYNRNLLVLASTPGVSVILLTAKKVRSEENVDFHTTDVITPLNNNISHIARFLNNVQFYFKSLTNGISLCIAHLVLLNISAPTKWKEGKKKILTAGERGRWSEKVLSWV